MLSLISVALASTLPAAPALMRAAVAPPVRSGCMSMQYDPYGAQQQGYGQQQGGGQALWRIHPTVGVSGHTRFQAFGPQYARATQKYSQVPYCLSFSGDEFVLGRWNMLQPSSYVSRQQCLVQILQDATAMLISTGKPATGVRSRGGGWNPLYNGQQYFLQDGDEVGLDANNPDGAIFTFENAAMQQGGYGQQQQQYGQQQQYDQQQQYGQQPGGYGGQQQGGYY